MTVLVKSRMQDFERWTHHLFTLTSGKKAFKGGMACGNVGVGKVVPGATGTTLVNIGKFDEDVDASAGDKPVNVNLCREIEVEWWDNDLGGTPVVAADVFGVCYILDDQTVTGDATGASIAGRVWAVDPVRGVAVEKLIPSP